MTARICSIRAVEGGARLLLRIEVDDGTACSCETLSLLCATCSRLPQVGQISEAYLQELRFAAAVCGAVQAGLRMLGACGCSRRHLVQKLRARGYDGAVAEAAVAELAQKGYLREEEGAVREAERGLGKLWGDRRILADLQAKGYSGGALKYAAARLRGEDGAARCVLLLHKRYKGVPQSEAEQRKLLAALTRYGYCADEIRTALHRIKEE